MKTTNKAILSSLSSLIILLGVLFHSAAVIADSPVYNLSAWGDNGYRQLGTYTGEGCGNYNSPCATTPALIDLANVVDIDAGTQHSMAVKIDGTVWIWGANYFKSYEYPLMPNGGPSFTPIQVHNLTNVIAVSITGGHALALKSDGTVWAWGYNIYGQLGNGTTTNSQDGVPVQVTGLSGVVAIAASAYTSLALKADGTVWAWGGNHNGLLGITSTEQCDTRPDYSDPRYIQDCSTVPVQVNGLDSVTTISAGGAMPAYIALKSDGTAWAWGHSNYTGLLGDGTWNDRTTPVQVSGLTGVTDITLGGSHAMAIKSDGTLWVWGGNRKGQFGNGTTSIKNNIPIQVDGVTGVTKIAGGAHHSMIRKSDGTVWTWGSNSRGQLGNGTTTDSMVPIQVGGLSGVTEISAGNIHNMVLKSQ